MCCVLCAGFLIPIQEGAYFLLESGGLRSLQCSGGWMGSDSIYIPISCSLTLNLHHLLCTSLLIRLVAENQSPGRPPPPPPVHVALCRERG